MNHYVLRSFYVWTGVDEPPETLSSGDLAGLDRKVMGLDYVSEVKHFGRGDRLSPLRSFHDVVNVIREAGPDIYSFSDVRDLMRQSPHVHWELEIRPVAIAVRLSLRLEAVRIADLADQLVGINKIMLESIPGASVRAPYSVADCLSVPAPDEVAPGFSAISPRGIVDVLYLGLQDTEPHRAVIEALRESELVEGAQRQLYGQLLAVTWGDGRHERIEEIIRARQQWYSEHLTPVAKEQENERGDREVRITSAPPIEGFAGYDADSQVAVKGLVFDHPDEAVPILEELTGILESGRTPGGQPIRSVVLVVPSRDDAVSLTSLAARYGMEVVYVGSDGRLWAPDSRAERGSL